MRLINRMFLAGFLCLFASKLYAGEAAALRLRLLIQATPDEQTQLAHLPDTHKLRVTAGFHQKLSQLCWGFGTINMLETNYLENHPEVSPEQVELSRWYIGKLAGSQQQRGTSIDALYYYIASGGIVMNADYPVYGPAAPQKTNFLGQDYTPAELFNKISGEQVYWSYAFSGNQSGWARHPDPDARSGTQSFFLAKDQMDDLILSSIIGNRKSVTYTEGGHIVQIYGATLDAQGKVQFYHVKDSYSPFFYDAAASRVHQNGFEVTTVAELSGGL